MIPGVSGFMGNNAIAKAALDGWQWSGVTKMTGGTRGGFTYSFTGAPSQETLTGGLGGSRVVLVCDPNLPRSQRTFDRQFRTECIQPPGPLTNASDTLYQGSALGDEWVGLGFVNHDMVLFKNFGLGRGRTFRMQLEAYNLFNSTQYGIDGNRGAVNTSAVFDFATGAQTNTAFGRVQGVRANSNRVIQLGARFTFSLTPHSPLMHAALGRILALSGKRALALETLRKLEALAKQRYVSPFEFARFASPSARPISGSAG